MVCKVCQWCKYLIELRYAVNLGRELYWCVIPQKVVILKQYLFESRILWKHNIILYTLSEGGGGPVSVILNRSKSRSPAEMDHLMYSLWLELVRTRYNRVQNVNDLTYAA